MISEIDVLSLNPDRHKKLKENYSILLSHVYTEESYTYRRVL
jgi:hypothetical protein